MFSFPGLNGPDKPIECAFPKLALCFECGFTEFTVPEKRIERARAGHCCVGATVLAERAPGRGCECNRDLSPTDRCVVSNAGVSRASTLILGAGGVIALSLVLCRLSHPSRLWRHKQNKGVRVAE
jgi:hypothetical protein